MPTPSFSSENVSAFIDHILKTKDPAVVGLQRILKNKVSEGRDFPLKEAAQEDFGTTSGGKQVFNESEKRLLTLEKTIRDLQTEAEARKAKVQTALQSAYEKGVQEGALRGRKEGEQKAADDFNRRLKTLEERIAVMIREVAAAKLTLYTTTQRQLLDIALMLARKIVNHEISLNPDIILSVIQKVFSYIATREQVVVRVSPHDFETVTGKKEFWTTLNERLDGIRIEKDSRIQPGGCIIDSAAGIADGRVEVQLDELSATIEQAWNEHVSTASQRAQENASVP
jgi:flagellar assembly protein FliH